MQEHAVTAAGTTYPLPEPFFVLATQNPIEQEGTYPLPEAQLDRFMLELRVRYPSRADEERIVVETTGDARPSVTPVLSGEQLLAMQHLVRRIACSHGGRGALARMTCPGGPTFSRPPPSSSRGARPQGPKPRAPRQGPGGARGRPMADLDDIRAIGPAVPGTGRWSASRPRPRAGRPRTPPRSACAGDRTRA
jgi:MoxR-like ATPase